MGDHLGTAGVVGFLFFFFHMISVWLSSFHIWHLFFTLCENSYRVFTHILHTKAHCGKAATAYDHTTLSTPVLVWSLKLSSVGPTQYLNGWPPGNSRCCRLLFFFFHMISVWLSSFNIWHLFFTLCANSYRVFTHILHTKAHCGKAATAYDHTTLSTPVLVWSLKLSSLGPAQSWIGYRLGTAGVVGFFFFLPHNLSLTFFFSHLTSFLYFVCKLIQSVHTYSTHKSSPW